MNLHILFMKETAGGEALFFLLLYACRHAWPSRFYRAVLDGRVMVQVLIVGITVDTFRRLVVFSLFWHFLDLVWIFIFTFVYLMGVI